MDLANRIQSLRKQKGLSQEELADRLGVSRQAVSKWESAQSVPDVEKIIALSEFFEVTTDYLLKGTEAPQPSGDDAFRTLRRDLMIACAAAAGVMAFAANRFRNIEILLIVLAGALIGRGLSAAIQSLAAPRKK